MWPSRNHPTPRSLGTSDATASGRTLGTYPGQVHNPGKCSAEHFPDPFPAAPHRTGHATYHRTRLSSVDSANTAVDASLWMSSWQSRQTIRVLRWRAAIRTDPFGLCGPIPGGRSFRRRMWCTSTSVCDRAELAAAGHEPADEFVPALPPNSGEFVLEDYPRGPAGQRDPTPAGHQRLLPGAPFDGDLQSSARACGCLPGGTVTVPDLADAELVLMAQRLGHRPFHDVPQRAETVPVVGQLVVLRDAPELRLVPRARYGSPSRGRGPARRPVYRGA